MSGKYPHGAMAERRAVRGLPLAGVATVGVLVGHWLAYVVAVPDPAARAGILAASGHSYWVLAIKLAVVLAVVGVGTLVLRHLSGTVGRPGDRPETQTLSEIAAKLSVIQVFAFTGMELAERVTVGAPVGHLFHHRIFLVGLAVQVLVSCAGAVILSWLDRAVRRLCRVEARPFLPLRQVWSSRLPVLLRTAASTGPLVGGTGLRGPPLPPR
jgi:hypothetical protein